MKETKYTSYEKYLQEQLSQQDWKTIQKMGLNLETKAWADLAVDFVNFERRTQKETHFLLSQIREYQKPRIFDACLGTGATSIGLQLASPNMIIIANEIDPSLEKIAMEEIRRRICRKEISIRHHDWREGIIYHKDISGSNLISPEIVSSYDRYSAVLCLGNALTYIFKREDQLKVLMNFREALRPRGKLIIDERNYAEHFLAPNSQFKCSGEVVYCGIDKVRPSPIFISQSMVIMQYNHLSTGQRAHLVLYPFKKGEMRGLLEKVGFEEIKEYGDYKEHFDPKEPEFITYVARK